MSKVRLGIENLLANKRSLLTGKKVGLITSPTGVDSRLHSTIELLIETGTKLTALFGPEHGVRGNAQAGAKVSSSIDEKTGLPIYSLYGPTKKPTQEMLTDVEILIFDMQDVGCRYYTFLYTMAYAQQAAYEYGKEFIILDRPNPLGGLSIEGNLVHTGYTSFVGGYPLPIRIGLTIGELGEYLAKFHGVGKPTVIELSGWERGMYYQDTELLWVPPSPNIPNMDTAFVYPGACLFEGTNLSEGRGTTKPFEIIGAPWLNAFDLSEKLNRLSLPGVIFRPTFFVPTFSKHSGRECQGVQLHITNYTAFQPVKTALYMLAEIFKYPESEFLQSNERYFFDLLAGNPLIKELIKDQAPVIEIWEQMQSENQYFVKQASSILLY